MIRDAVALSNEFGTTRFQHGLWAMLDDIYLNLQT